MNKEKKKVLIVDDSVFMRVLIRDIINSDEELYVVGIAKDGYEALVMLKELKPDVITLDVEMPRMDGITTLKVIMREQPTPVVMLSALTGTGAELTIKALENGAVDFITKPSGTISLDIRKISKEILEKVKLASKVPINKFKTSSRLSKIRSKPIQIKKTVLTKNKKRLVVIACSTGGPKALNDIVPRLPLELPAPVLIVQHMPASFTRFLAERLNTISPLDVHEAIDKEPLLAGNVYIAPGDYHLEIRANKDNYHIHLHQGPSHKGVRPSADIMMKSIAKYFDGLVVAAILTGMGSDGADGLASLKEKGITKSIAQNKETCVVFGMPGAAIKRKLIDKIIPLNRIVNTIVSMLMSE